MILKRVQAHNGPQKGTVYHFQLLLICGGAARDESDSLTRSIFLIEPLALFFLNILVLILHKRQFIIHGFFVSLSLSLICLRYYDIFSLDKCLNPLWWTYFYIHNVPIPINDLTLHGGGIKSYFSHIGVCYLPEDKVDVEQELPAEGVAPAAQEKGADDREQVIHNALVYLQLSTVIHQKNSDN